MYELFDQGQFALNDPKLHELLNQSQFGDRLKLATYFSGPVLSDQTRDPSVVIDLDGRPHIVRTPTGIVWAPIFYANLRRDGELVATWAKTEADKCPACRDTQRPCECGLL